MSDDDIVERLRRDGNLDPEAVVTGRDLRYLLEAALTVEVLRDLNSKLVLGTGS